MARSTSAKDQEYLFVNDNLVTVQLNATNWLCYSQFMCRDRKTRLGRGAIVGFNMGSDAVGNFIHRYDPE
ncbi:hypothetical protein PAECIP111802_00290 [Paenibacillus allorhizosphaerae]|uniref:Uncharacterized protein n=1 Tax=Paenibacillus allorhizosphaerae TaxID=2849866 RepID=A0ABM8VAG8_9BACL|nr:hypothetical protein PAECIP111802_00290 [Paenibacillus allorhizosphaerae]